VSAAPRLFAEVGRCLMIVFHEQLVLPDMLPVKLHLAHILLDCSSAPPSPATFWETYQSLQSRYEKGILET
jgi:hypothetical protein